MSFALTTPQILDRSKTVTRRVGWTFLKAGDQIQPVNKVMGMKLGEKPQPVGGPIRVVSVRREPLNAITVIDVMREGFPDLAKSAFIDFFCATHRHCGPDTQVTRIEFEYVEAES